MAADGSGYVLQSLLVMLERRFKRDSELLARSASYRVSRQPSNRQGDLSLAKIGSSAEAPPARGRMGGPRGADDIHQAPPRIWGGLRSGNGIRAIILWKPGEASSGRTIENVAVAQFTVNLARRIFSALPLLDCARVRRLRSRARCVEGGQPTKLTSLHELLRARS